jgi:hypothetical protein
MLTTGNQLRAARALAGLKQDELAKLAGLNTSTISAMETKAAGALTSGMDRSTGLSVPWIQAAFEQRTTTGALALKCMRPVNVVNEAARVILAFGVTAVVVTTTVYTIRWLIG